jgi:hypothetical protein
VMVVHDSHVIPGTCAIIDAQMLLAGWLLTVKSSVNIGKVFFNTNTHTWKQL